MRAGDTSYTPIPPLSTIELVINGMNSIKRLCCQQRIAAHTVLGLHYGSLALRINGVVSASPITTSEHAAERHFPTLRYKYSRHDLLFDLSLRAYRVLRFPGMYG